jgi:hypothetical protein
VCSSDLAKKTDSERSESVRSELFGSKPQQGHVAGPFDRQRQLPLMLGAVAGDPAGQDLAALGGKPADAGNFFIVNGFDFIDAEAADFFLRLSAFVSFHLQ